MKYILLKVEEMAYFKAHYGIQCSHGSYSRVFKEQLCSVIHDPFTVQTLDLISMFRYIPTQVVPVGSQKNEKVHLHQHFFLYFFF